MHIIDNCDQCLGLARDFDAARFARKVASTGGTASASSNYYYDGQDEDNAFGGDDEWGEFGDEAGPGGLVVVDESSSQAGVAHRTAEVDEWDDFGDTPSGQNDPSTSGTNNSANDDADDDWGDFEDAPSSTVDNADIGSTNSVGESDSQSAIQSPVTSTEVDRTTEMAIADSNEEEVHVDSSQASTEHGSDQTVAEHEESTPGTGQFENSSGSLVNLALNAVPRRVDDPFSGLGGTPPISPQRRSTGSQAETGASPQEDATALSGASVEADTPASAVDQEWGEFADSTGQTDNGTSQSDPTPGVETHGEFDDVSVAAATTTTGNETGNSGGDEWGDFNDSSPQNGGGHTEDQPQQESTQSAETALADVSSPDTNVDTENGDDDEWGEFNDSSPQSERSHNEDESQIESTRSLAATSAAVDTHADNVHGAADDWGEFNDASPQTVAAHGEDQPVASAGEGDRSANAHADNEDDDDDDWGEWG